jgi:hypothetical protein
MRMPRAPSFMAAPTAFFIARRKDTRRSSCVATVSETSCAFVSALRISCTSMTTSSALALV